MDALMICRLNLGLASNWRNPKSYFSLLIYVLKFRVLNCIVIEKRSVFLIGKEMAVLNEI